MNWAEFGQKEAAAIKRRVIANLDAAIDFAQKTPP